MGKAEFSPGVFLVILADFKKPVCRPPWCQPCRGTGTGRLPCKAVRTGRARAAHAAVAGSVCLMQGTQHKHREEQWSEPHLTQGSIRKEAMTGLIQPNHARSNRLVAEIVFLAWVI